MPASAARRLFLGAQGLLAPAPGGDRPALLRLIRRLGFVQIDTIHVIERAQHLTLFSRMPGYRPEQLQTLAEQDRAVFEAFTHDASLVPTEWYEHWRPRFRRDHVRIRANRWWQSLLGERCDEVCAHVLERIEQEGPLGSADFDHPERRGPWWGWKPQKAALDYLWRSGRLAVAGRVSFHKRYDLPERVYPEAHARPEPAPEAHEEWACSEAAERLCVFTPKELADYFAAVDAATAKGWCDRAGKSGRVVPVMVESADGAEPRPAFAVAGWETTLRELPDPVSEIRLLSPFDPILRDRARALRRFGFDYRFEAFTPEPKRVYGYYVLPLLERDRLVGRLDAKLHRGEGVLEVKGLWWEPGVRATKGRTRALGRALERLAGFLGARDVVGVG